MSFSASVAVHPSEGIYTYRGPLPRRSVFTSLPRSSTSSMTESSSSSYSSSHIRNRSVDFSANSDHGFSLPNPSLSPSHARAFVKHAPSNHSMVSKVSTKIDNGNAGSRHSHSNGEDRDHEDSDVAAQRLWYKLEDHRRTIRRLRKNIKTERRSLRSMHKKLAEADNTFMNSLRKVVYSPRASNGLRENVIMGLFKTMQDLRTRNGIIEVTLYQLEDDLENEELASEQTEDAFFRHIYEDSALGSDYGGGDDGDSAGANPRSLDSNEDRPPPSRTSLLGIPPDRPVDLHPTYSKLLSAIGDKIQATEGLEDIVGQRDAILEDIERRRKIDRRRDFNRFPVTQEELDTLKSDLANIAEIDQFLQKNSIDIDDEDLEFLKSYPNSEKEARELVKSTTIEVKRLGSLCAEQGAMLKHPTLSQDYIVRKSLGKPTDHLHMDIDLEPFGLQQGRHSLAHPNFDILLSDPAHVLERKSAKAALKDAIERLHERASPEATQEVQRYEKEVAIESLVTEHVDKTQMVNNWILQQLRTKPLEVRCLLNTFTLTTKLRVKDFARWQNDVLRFWNRDEAAKLPASAFDGPLTSVDSLDLNLNRHGIPNKGESVMNSAADPKPLGRSLDAVANVSLDEDPNWAKVTRPESIG